MAAVFTFGIVKIIQKLHLHHERVHICGEDVRQAGLSTNLATSMNQEPESLTPSAIVA